MTCLQIADIVIRNRAEFFKVVKKALYFTATPVNANGVRMLPAQDGTPGDCGKILSSFSLSQAVEAGVCKDFKILVMFSEQNSLSAGGSSSGLSDVLEGAAGDGGRSSSSARGEGRAAAAAGGGRGSSKGGAAGGGAPAALAAGSGGGRARAGEEAVAAAHGRGSSRVRGCTPVPAGAAGSNNSSSSSNGFIQGDGEDECLEIDGGEEEEENWEEEEEETEEGDGSNWGGKGGLDNAKVLRMLARAIARTKKGRVLLFLKRATKGDGCVKDFAVAENEALLQKYLAEAGADWVQDVRLAGTVAQDRNRVKLLSDFDATPPNSVFVLVSCRTLGEGVDTRTGEMAAFPQAKGSYVATIQVGTPSVTLIKYFRWLQKHSIIQ